MSTTIPVPPQPVSVAVPTPLTTGGGEIDAKYAALGGARGFLGQPTGAERAIAGGRMRPYTGGSIYWSADTGAHEVHGAILTEYLRVGGPGGVLGFPRTDETAGARPGVRKSRFAGGVVIWSSATGAHELHGEIFVHYMRLGGEAGPFGLPVSGELATPNGGRRNELQHATIYWSPRSGAFEVHGAIRDRYRALNGPAGFLGYPLTDESDVLTKSGAKSGGKLSRFEGGTIYWSAASGAFEVHGAIRELYEKSGGPMGDLGYPVTNESGISGTADLRYNDFQKGIVVWRPWAGARAITKLELFLERVAAGKIDDGIADSSAELVTYVTVQANGQTLQNNTRMPSGHAGTSYTYNKTYTISPVNHATAIRLKIKVDDWDQISANDYLGTLDRTFDIRSVFGLDGAPNGVYFNQPATHKGGDAPSLSTLQFFFRISPPGSIDPSKPFRNECWWRFDNFTSPKLSRSLYTQTFTDVEVVGNDFEKYFLNPFDTLFYETAYKSVAAKGNCFGMSLEAIYSRVGRSLFVEPLYQHQAVGDKTQISGDADLSQALRETINRKHGFQLGASAINWIISRLTNLDAVRPLSVYERVKFCLNRGDWPTVSMVKLDGFSGHAVLPYRCIDGAGSAPHRILVADPNVAWREKEGDPTYIEIRKNNTFRFVGGDSVYESTTFSGTSLPSTLLFEIPFHRLSAQPRTPFWEILMAIAFLLGGILILAGDAETEQITADGAKFYRPPADGNPRPIVPNSVDGMARIPLLDYDGPLAELYAKRGRMPRQLQIDLKGKKKGSYEQGIRSAQGGVVVSTPVAAGAKDAVIVQDAANAAPVVEVTTSETGKTAKVSYAPTLDENGLARVRYTADLALAKGERARVLPQPGEGVLVAPAGKAAPFAVEVASVVRGKLESRTLRVTPGAAGEAVSVRPERPDAPVGSIVVERLDRIGGKVVDRRIDRP